MLDFSLPVTFHQAGTVEASHLIADIHAFCKSGRNIHQESLKTIVLKLTYYSRDLNLSQAERDDAAELATHMANAAIRKYGQKNSFTEDLIASVQMILGKHAAA